MSGSDTGGRSAALSRFQELEGQVGGAEIT